MGVGCWKATLTPRALCAIHIPDFHMGNLAFSAVAILLCSVRACDMCTLFYFEIFTFES